ncbi:MAG TPA: PAS domain-containing sensor histidine kinase [Devosiaceae bacterium]|jgi:sigma-B regulation protein RsbU (phosphoserine phosphatase)
MGDLDLEDIYENAPCGHLSLAPDGRIVRVNRTLCDWLGMRAEDLLGKRFLDLLNVAGRMFYETHFAPLLRMQGFFHEVALDFVIPTGGRLPVIANATEKHDEDGRLLFTRIALFKAPQRRQYERDLVDAKKQVQELNATLETRIAEAVQMGEVREQFIAVLGHDLRNPLAAIDSGANVLLREGWTERTPRVLRLMKNSTQRMQGLIDNILDLARARLGGGIQLQIDAARPLAPTLIQVIDEIRTNVPDRKFEIRLELETPVGVDHARIAQMFSNLLGNAVTHGAEEIPISVTAQTSGDVFTLSVANGGEPIPPELMAHLFQPFYRGDVRASLQGLGLGLYIASEIARAHGGRIDVVSDLEATRFTFTMPLAR